MMKPRLSLAIIAAFTMGLGAAWTPTVTAQSNLEPSPPSEQPGVDQPSSAEQLGIGRQELKTFAVATREVNQIDADYQPKVEAATSPEERQQIEEEAMDKMVQSVEDKGLSVGQYNQIALLAEFDPSVAQQIATYLNEPE
jgi:hypothetical protein